MYTLIDTTTGDIFATTDNYAAALALCDIFECLAMVY